MNKLQGDEYRKFWQERMAKGPLEAGFIGMDKEAVHDQANDFMFEIHMLLRCMDSDPDIVAEFGVGWGRMASRMFEIYPMMDFTGFDICPEALEGCRERSEVEEWEAKFFCVESISNGWFQEFDLIYTCTCLQHITDSLVFDVALQSIRAAVQPGGYVLIFENITDGTKTRSLRGYGSGDFTQSFALANWTWVKSSRIVRVKGEPHRGFLFRKPL